MIFQQPLKHLSAVLLVAVAMTLASGQAMANQIFAFSFTGATASGFGTLTAVVNGDGSFTAISGSGTETVNGATDTLNLIFNPNGKDLATSASGAFFFDNQLLPSTDPFIANGGLLFQTSTQELNLYSTSPGQYLFYQQNRYNESTAFTLTAVADGAGVPEPTTVFLLGAGFVGLVASRRNANTKQA